MQKKKYHTGQIHLNYGKGRPNGIPLLLIHGSGSIWQDWNPLITAFSDKIHCPCLFIQPGENFKFQEMGYFPYFFTALDIAITFSTLQKSVILLAVPRINPPPFPIF